MTIPADLNVYISALLFFLGAYLIALYLGLIVWTFRDIRSRSRDLLAQILSIFLVAFFTLPGLIIYLLLRPQETLTEAYERELAEEAIIHELEERRVCPNCKHGVEPEFIVCPHCHQQLRLRCVGCGRLLDLDWDVCPYCGLLSEQEEGEEEATADEKEEERVPEMAPVGEAATLSEADGSGDETSGETGAGKGDTGDPLTDEELPAQEEESSEDDEETPSADLI